MKKENILKNELKNEIEELNAPKLKVDGVEEYEDRIEMKLGKMCSMWLFGG